MKGQLCVERVQNRFFEYVSCVLKLKYPPHDYFIISTTLSIQNISRRVQVDTTPYTVCFVNEIMLSFMAFYSLYYNILAITNLPYRYNVVNLYYCLFVCL